MTTEQEAALRALCGRYGVEFEEGNYRPVFELPSDWVAGWIGEYLYVGCDPTGSISS